MSVGINVVQVCGWIVNFKLSPTLYYVDFGLVIFKCSLLSSKTYVTSGVTSHSVHGRQVTVATGVASLTTVASSQDSDEGSSIKK